jgi:4-hydroxy-3-polyprenylbenzoate decarboxylase
MAAIHLRVHEAGGPAILFENVMGSRIRAASNIFGTIERSRFIFRETLAAVQQLIELRNNPAAFFKSPLQNSGAALSAITALPMKNALSRPVMHQRLRISDLPQIQHWPMDGGAFVTLPQVYTEDVDQPGIMHANLGSNTYQLSGNDYLDDAEIWLALPDTQGHWCHQAKANKKGNRLRSVYLWRPPSYCCGRDALTGRDKRNDLRRSIGRKKISLLL